MTTFHTQLYDIIVVVFDVMINVVIVSDVVMLLLTMWQALSLFLTLS